MKRILVALSIITIITTITTVSFSQVVYEPVTNNGVYDLLDELATLKIITINSVVKPYSRMYIAEKLREADQRTSGPADTLKRTYVSNRLREEIDFYLRDYVFELGIRNEKLGIQGSKVKVQDSARKNDAQFLIPNSSFLIPRHPASFSYDPLSFNVETKPFRMSIRPALGARFIVNENGNVWDLSGGGEVFGYVGKHVGYYFNVKQTWQSEALVKPEYFTMEEGKVWRNAGNGSVRNTEWRGGISVAWRWGDFGVYKDRPIWGNGVHGTNILSGHAPPFPFIQLHVKPAKWIEFRYIHGWLKTDEPGLNPFSEDSAYASYCQGHSKYIAANMLTLKPWKGLDLSVGNSIIYSDVNPSPFMLIPFMFFNPVDNERTAYNDYASSNSQIFASISSRQINHLHLFVTLYIDELKVSRILTSDQYNFTSWKAGFTLWDLPLKNLSFFFEWTYTKPITYKHYVVATNFNNDSYNMGDWMRDNSQEFFVAVGYRPLKELKISVSYVYDEHGTEYPYYRTGRDVTRLPVLTDLSWINSSFSTEVIYQIFSNASVRFRYTFSNRKGDIGYDSKFMHGKTNTIEAGIILGF